MSRLFSSVSAALLISLFAHAASAQESPPGVPPAPVPPGHTVLPYAQLVPPALVTFDSNAPGTRLEMEAPSGWVPMCEAPCRVAVDPRGTYHADGPGMPTSRELHFSPGKNAVDVHAGSTGLRALGIVATSAGGFVTLIALAVASASCIDGCDSAAARNSRDDAKAAAATVALVGVVGLAAGIAMIVSSGTDVSATRSAAAPRWTARGLSF